MLGIGLHIANTVTAAAAYISKVWSNTSSLWSNNNKTWS